MKYTHQDIEADRKLPVGSLFMHLMDDELQLPHTRRCDGARRPYERTLAHTSLDLYEDKNECISRTATPLRGRRHFPAREREHGGAGSTAIDRLTRSPCRRRAASAHSDQLGRDLRPLYDVAPEVRGRRFIAEPRAADVVDAQERGRKTGAYCLSTPLRHRRLSSSSLTDHLSLSTLVPQPEPPKPRPVPPPLIVRPRHTGLKHFPERRSSSADTMPRGVRRVPPPPHFRSVADRQWDFLELGAGCNEFRQPCRRRVQHTDVLNTATPSDNRDSATAKPSRPHPVKAVPASADSRCYGRARAMTPQRRSYDIITGRPLPYLSRS